MKQDSVNDMDESPRELVETALAAWCDLHERGESVERETFLEQYDAAIRGELSQCLKAFDFIQRAVPRTESQSAWPIMGDASGFGLPFRLGDFEVEEEIGRGGMGVVYRAVQVSLDRQVAIKILPFAALLDGRQLERFRNEARAAAMLKHPNIVSVLSVGYERGLHYYAMELVEGSSLAEILRTLADDEQSTSATGETKPIAELSTRFARDRAGFFRSVARLGIQAGDALQTAHEAGIIHRDIKPSNLLLDRDGRPLIADFGLARMQSDQGVTMTGDVLGTLRYMSPEQLQSSQSADQRSDVYSLGLTMYELVAGRPAFEATEKAQLITKIIDGDMPPLHRQLSTTPRDLETIIAKSVSLNADARYQSASELTDDLQRYVDGKPVLARRVGAVERILRWSNRNPSKALLVALVTAIVFAAAISGPIVAYQQANERQRQTALVELKKHEAYSADMRQSQDLLERGETDQVIRLLQKYIPKSTNDVDYRNFEWRFLAAQCNRWRAMKPLAISHAFYCCDLSPDEKWLATGTMFSGVAAFETSTGKLAWRNEGGEVYCVRFSTDNQWLVTSGFGKHVKIFDIRDGSLLFSQQFEAYPRALATYGNRLLVSLNSDGLPQEFDDSHIELQLFRICDSNESMELRHQASVDHLPRVSTLRFSPDGQMVTGTCADGIIRLWDGATLELLKSNRVSRHERLTGVNFSADGKSLILGSSVRDDRRMAANAYVIDVESLEQTATLPHLTEVCDAQFTKDGRCLTASFDGKISVWSKQGKLLDRFSAASKGISEIASAQNGTVYAACLDSKLVQMRTDESSATWETGEFWGGMDVSFHPNGKEVACATKTGRLRIYDVATGTRVRETDAASYRIWATDYSSDGKYLAAIATPYPTNKSESELIILDATTGDKIHQTKIPDVNYARSLRFAPNHNQLAVVGNGKLFLFDILQMKFSAPVAAGDDGSHVFHVDFTRDGRFVGTTTAWGGGGGIRIWHYPSMEPVMHHDGGEAPRWWGFALDGTGKHFAICDHVNADHAISIRELTSGDHVRSLIGHSNTVLSLQFSQDDKRLLSSGQDGDVILWNLETGQEIQRFREHSGIAWRARFSPDGSSIASIQMTPHPSLVLRLAMTMGEAEAIVRPPVQSKIFPTNVPKFW